MSSLLTNTSAMVALSTLRNINNDLADTQNRISTGMRVSDASDNAAYWSIATTMRSDNNALSAVEDALGLGAATVDVAFTAMDSAVDVVDQIKSKLVAATKDGVDKSKIQSDISELQSQLETIAKSATFNGENWLAQDTTTANIATTPPVDNPNRDVVGGFTRDNNGNASLQNIAIDTSNVILFDYNAVTDSSEATASVNSGILTGDMMMTAATGIKALADAAVGGTADFTNLTGTATPAAAGGELSFLNLDISNLTGSDNDKAILEAVIQVVDAKLQTMTDSATSLGSAKSRIDMQTEFVKNLSDAVDRGVGQLVDADMNAESTRLQALQTQQQLGIQALSIANSGSQNILSLFR
ncbi:flagellin [Pseudovibrio sp. SPO723]|uniref:flagellin N-terminal helical domain-containing protein n=1 Tax=Nesiotobacter zosterae TaxID=392721 RepID=UPI0029C1F002|nr:flagellin [Pseudovibrio sp. SPO723]MDX5593335.1 flagellin [Pseudovibrio sp. SPO723]